MGDIDLVAVQVIPSQTQIMINRMKQIWKPLHDNEEFEVTSLGESAVGNNQFHFVFVLDESGSMKNSWNDLLACYDRFRQLRCGDQSNDIISVVTFNNSAKSHFSGKPPPQAHFQAALRGGGTSFIPALNEAFRVLGNHSGYTPVMVFMSDGYGEASQSVCQVLGQGARRLNQFRFFAVAFRKSSSTLDDMVQTMRASNVPTELLRSNDRMSLQKNFEQVAATSKVTEVL